jgi:glycine/D-amino acid oxidase-like deaminating enzyme
MASAHWRKATFDGRLTELTRLGFQLHQELADVLWQESGIDIGYREQPMIHLAFSTEDVESLKSQLPAQKHDDPSIRWLDGPALREVEPRLNQDALGGTVSQGAQVKAYRLVLALMEAAERRGVELRHGEVVGLQSDGGQVTGVQLRQGGTIATETVVLAMGPWSQQFAARAGLTIPIYPVRGQLLELLVPTPQLRASPSYSDMYLLHKADGITLAGTTYEQDSGFANHPTSAGFKAIMNAALRMAPSLEDAQVLRHVSGLRPASVDSLPLIGPVPGWQGLYIASGHDRRGMGLGLVSTRIITDLIATGSSSVSWEAFDPARIGSTDGMWNPASR